MIDSIIRDVHTALRALLRAPGFAVVILMTLAVAIGANTAIFSVVDGVLLRPLPFPEANRIIHVAARTRPEVGGEGEAPFSDRGYWHFVDNNQAFAQFGGYEGAPIQWPLTGEGPPLQVNVAMMTASAFELLGTPPQRGRFPSADEDVPGGAQVALVSDGLWRSIFGSDPGLIGRTVELNGSQWEIIGIMPRRYDFPTPETDVWIPRRLDPASENFGGHHIEGIARLAPGATVASAVSDAESLIARFGEAGYGPTWFTGVFTGEASVVTLQEELVGDARQPLLILLGTAAFVLLIACSNVANLFLARAEVRTRETAVRLALGSGRARLIRFVLTESVVLGLLGGVAGVILAYLGVRALVAAAPPMIPRLDAIGIDGSVLAFTAGISVFAGLLFGVLPALRTGAPRMMAALRDGGRGGTLGHGQNRARTVLVVAQVALAIMLVVGSGLMVRSFRQLRSVDPGFDAGPVVTFGVSLPPDRYQTPEDGVRFYEELIDNLEALPGVSAAGGINTLPLTGGGAILTTVIDEFPPQADEFPPVFLIRRATPGYFEAMGVPVVEGRSFTRDDSDLRTGALIISESIKNQYWPETSALGKRMTTAGAPARVVGVVGDLHDTGLDVPAEQFVYKPMLDSVGGGVRPMRMTVRADVDPMSLVPAIRGVVESMDPELPITDLQPMSGVVGDSLSRTTFTMSVLALAALIALFLGAVGIYGVISYMVSQRTGEIGVRQAIGANSRDVRRLILRQGMILAAAGVALGLVGAVAIGRIIASLLYGISPYDPVTLIGGSLIFLAVAALASALPSARAAAIPPAVALRSD